jgi:hypothetical protein
MEGFDTYARHFDDLDDRASIKTIAFHRAIARIDELAVRRLASAVPPCWRNVRNHRDAVD